VANRLGNRESIAPRTGTPELCRIVLRFTMVGSSRSLLGTYDKRVIGAVTYLSESFTESPKARSYAAVILDK
jgi:hypothetical protein